MSDQPDHDPSIEVGPGEITDPATLAAIDRAVISHVPETLAAGLGPVRSAWVHRSGIVTHARYDDGQVVSWRGAACRWHGDSEDRWWHDRRVLAPSELPRYAAGLQPRVDPPPD